MVSESYLREKVKIAESFSIEYLKKLLDGNNHEKPNQVLVNEVMTFAGLEARAAIEYFEQTNKSPYHTSQQ